MWLSVEDVQATDDHKFILTFESSERRCFDVSQLFEFGCFSELRDINKFKKVRVAFDPIEWENGLDLDPEFLYEKSEKMN